MISLIDLIGYCVRHAKEIYVREEPGITVCFADLNFARAMEIIAQWYIDEKIPARVLIDGEKPDAG